MFEDQVLVISTTVTFVIAKKFSPSLTDKILKEDKWENQDFHKNVITFLYPCFMLIASLYKLPNNVYKNIFLYSPMYSFLIKLFKKQQKTNKQKCVV